jgi:hypothetical protein
MAGVSGLGSSPKFGGYPALSEKPLPKTPEPDSGSSTIANPPSAPPSPPPKSRPQWAPKLAATSSNAPPPVPPKDEQVQTETQPLARQPTTSSASATSAMASQSRPNIPGLKSRPPWLDYPYETPGGNAPKRELRGSVSMSALKSQTSDPIKRGVREVKTDGMTGDTSIPRSKLSIRKLRTSTSAYFKKGGGSEGKGKGKIEKEKAEVDPNVIRLDPARDKHGLAALSAKKGQAAVDAVRQQGGEEKLQQIKDDIRDGKIRDMVDAAISAAEKEIFPLKNRTAMDIAKQSFRLPKTKKEDKTRKAELEAQLARSPEEWRAVVTENGRRMPEVTDDDVALYMQTSRKLEGAERGGRGKDLTIVSSSRQKASPKDPYDLSDAALGIESEETVEAEREAARAVAQKLNAAWQQRKKDDGSTS